jgi:hypothetical protein
VLNRVKPWQINIEPMKKKTSAKEPKRTEKQPWLTERRLRFYPLLLGLVALAAAFAFIVSREHYFLLRVQEMNLFLYTPLFFKQQLVVPGGLLTYAGTYFTQYFYHPWLGTLLLCLWCGLLLWLTAKAFRLPARWGALLLVPLVLVLLTDFDLGYWIYLLKLRGHFFITVIGCCVALSAVWAFRMLPARYGLRWVFMVLSAIVLYPVAGFYGLLATVLMAVMAWRMDTNTLGWKIGGSLLALILVGFVPMIYYRAIYYQTSSDDLWRTALPLFDTGIPIPQYYWPYGLLFGFFVLLALAHREERSARLLKLPAIWCLLQVVIIGGSVYGCWHYWYKDGNFHRELIMEDAVERADWQAILDVAATNPDEPTRMLWMYKNLAIFKLGRGGNEMYNYRNGSKKPESPFTLPIAVQGGKQLYLHYGLPNYCYRWCMEDGVEYGWRTLYLKYMVRCALVNSEYVLAQRYIDLLKQTRYHRDWALHYERLALQPSLIEKDPELGPIIPLLDHADVLASDQSVIETFLLTLLSSQPATNPLKADLMMQAALQQKSIPVFWRAFDQYVRTHPDGPMPRHYQEAAFMFGNLEHNVDISGMPFDPSIPEGYRQFMQIAKQNTNMGEEQLKQALKPLFGNTYYYDYFLMRGLKTY